MRTSVLCVLVLASALAGRAGATVSVAVVDGSATLAEVPPSPGSPAVRWSTTDFVRFSNEGANEPQLVVYSAAHSFRYDRDAGVTSGPIQHPGGTTSLADVFFMAQSSSGSFLPVQVSTATDRTGQAGWTKHPGCGTVSLQGELSVPHHANDGSSQTPLLLYYQTCEGSAELYVDADKDLSSGADLAYVVTSPQILPSEADYEVTIQGVDFAFSGVSGALVTLQQARFTPSTIPNGVTSVDAFFLYRFPDGFPAGVTTTTLTATATDIMV